MCTSGDQHSMHRGLCFVPRLLRGQGSVAGWQHADRGKAEGQVSGRTSVEGQDSEVPSQITLDMNFWVQVFLD